MDNDLQKLKEAYELMIISTDKVIVERLDIPIQKFNDLVQSLQTILKAVEKDDSVGAKSLRNKVRTILIELEPIQMQLVR